MDLLIDIQGLTVDFDDGRRVARALHGVDLRIAPGEALGLVGESGCGKSITWLAVLGLLGPRARVGGSATVAGRQLVGAPVRTLEGVRGRRVALIFQDPASCLNPVHRIGRQLCEALRLHRGLDRKAAEAEALRLLDRVGIPAARERMRDYPHQLSGGMNQRVMIAMALAGKPDLLVADEPTTALDATIQAQILELIGDIRRESGMATVLISHDLGVVAQNTDRIAVMYAGRIIEEAPSTRLFDRPEHPYTRGLVAALPDLEGPRRRLRSIPGSVPSPWNQPPGCSFAPRCLHAVEPCTQRVPALGASEPRHLVACIRAGALDRHDAATGHFEPALPARKPVREFA